MSKSTITTLSQKTFADCYKIKELKFPATLATIEAYTFEMVKDCDYYFYGLPPKLGQGAFKHSSKERSNVLILPENALTWTNNTVSGYVFTPLSEVPDSEKTDSYQFPKEGRVLGTLKLGPSDIGTHWLSLIPKPGLFLIVR